MRPFRVGTTPVIPLGPGSPGREEALCGSHTRLGAGDESEGEAFEASRRPPPYGGGADGSARLGERA